MTAVDLNHELTLARQLWDELKACEASWSYSGRDFEAWRNKVINLIRRVYSNSSPQERQFAAELQVLHQILQARQAQHQILQARQAQHQKQQQAAYRTRAREVLGPALQDAGFAPDLTAFVAKQRNIIGGSEYTDDITFETIPEVAVRFSEQVAQMYDEYKAQQAREQQPPTAYKQTRTLSSVLMSLKATYPTYDQRLPSSFSANAMAHMEALVQDLEMRAPSAAMAEQATHSRPKVFIAHGGETTLRNQLELFLWRSGYRPIVVEEMPSLGLGPDDNVNHYIKQSDFAVILVEKARTSVQDGKPQPRGNVIDELARIRAALGNKFKVLLEEGVSLHSNVSGAITWQQTSPDSFNKALIALSRELIAQGITGAQD